MELDFRAVRALSSPTRVKILRKALDEEATPTQLSRELDRSKSTISAHLSKLEKAGLLDKDKEKGRKRVVYSPTRKAEAIVSGKERKVKFSIASSAFTALVGLTVVGTQAGEYLGYQTAKQTADKSTELGAMGTEAMDTAAQEPSLIGLSPDILFYIGIALLGFSVLGFTYGWTIRKLTEG